MLIEQEFRYGVKNFAVPNLHMGIFSAESYLVWPDGNLQTAFFGRRTSRTKEAKGPEAM
jgi:hypothetical protein